MQNFKIRIRMRALCYSIRIMKFMRCWIIEHEIFRHQFEFAALANAADHEFNEVLKSEYEEATIAQNEKARGKRALKITNHQKDTYAECINY